MPDYPAPVLQLEAQLLQAYQDAWNRVTAELNAIMSDPRQWRRQARLKEVQAGIEDAMATVNQTALMWINQSLPMIYVYGEGLDPSTIDRSFFIVNQYAITKLATDLYDNLLAATNGVTESTKELIRKMVAQEITSGVIEGQTYLQTAQDLIRQLAGQVVGVTYADGSVHSLEEYATMAVRTITGQAYNLGTLRGPAGQGVEYFEVFDGPECGWTSHDDGDAADGSIRAVDECESYPLSHPNCRRAFGPRPDLNSMTPAEAGLSPISTTAGQIESQAAQDIVQGRSRGRRVQDIVGQRQARLDARAARLAGVR